MPTFEVTSPDGKTYEITAPDGATQDQVLSYAQQQFSMKPARAPDPSLKQKVQASFLGRVVQGMRDPIDAGAQLLPRGLEFATSVGGLFPNRVSEFLGDEAKRVDSMNAQAEKEYQDARTATGETGIDGGRIVGNIVSPANAGIARLLPIVPAATMGKTAARSAATGAAGGLLQPVNEMQDGQSFAATKAAQVGFGAAAGGLAAPVMSKVGELIGKQINSRNPANGARAAAEADGIIAQALREFGQSASDVSDTQMKALRTQVADAIKGGKKLDAAALLRKADFDALDVPATQGQITRDASQFAQERNLRAAPGIGEPLLNRFELQNQKLQQIASTLSGTPSEPYQAGKKIIGALQGVDDELSAPIGPAYQAARASDGRYAGVDVKGFSEAANQALDENMLGTYLPGEARNLLNDISSGKIPLNVNNLVQMDRILSTAQRSAGQGSPQALAIGKVRDALNAANIEGEAGQEAKAAFDAGRGLAARRFGMHKEIPALGAVAEGEAVPDNFVQKHIIGGNVEDVQKLASLLRNGLPQKQASTPQPNGFPQLAAPGSGTPLLSGQQVAQPKVTSNGGDEAFQEARAQIGEKIMRAAFGENQAGDKLAAPERLARAIREIGTDKLSAFYSPEEIQQMKQLSRVAAYINSTPTAAPVMGNPNGAWAFNLLSKFPGVPASAALLSSAARTIDNSRAVGRALNVKVPQKAADLTPEQIQLMAKLLSLGGAGAGGLSSSSLR